MNPSDPQAGRGFAVLAQQIRKLADVTRTVSDQVNALIRESNQAIGKNVQTVQGLMTHDHRMSVPVPRDHAVVSMDTFARIAPLDSTGAC